MANPLTKVGRLENQTRYGSKRLAAKAGAALSGLAAAEQLKQMKKQAKAEKRGQTSLAAPASNGMGADAFTSGVSGSAAGQPSGRAQLSETWQGFAGMTTSQKILVLLLLPLLLPFLALFAAFQWLWTSPRFTTKTKAVVTAVSVAAIGIMAAVGSASEEPATSVPATSVPGPRATVTTVARADPMTSLGVSCTQLDGMMEQAWDLGNNGLADAYESVWASDCRGRM